VGIHLVIATQRPTTNIITGSIKANFPARIAFRVTSMIDSRTIIDIPGANQLVGRGDMLMAPGSDITRLQCAFIDIPEIERITNFINAQPGLDTPFYLPEYINESDGDLLEVDLSKRDPLFDDAARLVATHQSGSTSLLQRKFSIGYNRAGKIMDQLEAAGIVGPPEGSKPRQVFYTDMASLEHYLLSLNS
jgi:S-DNA-T family DNA segregation ATPase FtsK/SpoIIIE